MKHDKHRLNEGQAAWYQQKYLESTSVQLQRGKKEHHEQISETFTIKAEKGPVPSGNFQIVIIFDNFK